MVNDPIKIQSMKTVLKNPKMAKMIFSAIKSPSGSTKRKEAQNVLKSFYTAHLNKHNKSMMSSAYFQGQGGPQEDSAAMDDLEPMPSGMISSPEQSSTPLFAPKPIKKRINFENPPPFINEIQNQSSFGGPNILSSAAQGQGGPYDGKGGDLPGNTSYQQGSRLGETVGNIGSGLQTGGNWLTNAWNNAVSGVGRAGSAALNFIGYTVPQTVGKAALSIPAALQAGAEYTAGGLIPGTTRPPSLTGTAGGRLLGEMWGPNSTPAPYDADPRYSNPASQYPNLIKPNPAQAAPTSTQPPIQPVDLKSGAAYSYSPPLTSAQTVPPGGASFTDPTHNPSVQGAVPTKLYDHMLMQINQGLPATAAAMAIMHDASLYDELYPDIPVDQRPVGASLVGQLADLHEKISQKAGLDALHDDLMATQNRSGKVTEMSQAYIRGKDTYLQQLNKMLDDAQSQYLNSSQGADPYYAKQMSQYINYLSVLKGRTTQRYTDYVNTQINEHNAHLTELQNAYNSTKEQVDKTYLTQGALTEEQYNETKANLESMYTNIAARNGLLDKIGGYTTDVIKTNADTMKSVLDTLKILPDSQHAQVIANLHATGLLSGIDTSNIQKTGSPPNAADIKVLTDNVFPNVTDVFGALNDPLVRANNYDTGIVMQQYLVYRANELATGSLASGGKLDENHSIDEASLSGLKQTDPAQLGYSPDQWAQIIASYTTQLNNAYQKGIDAYVSANSALIKPVLQSMTNKKDTFDSWSKYNNKNTSTGGKWAAVPQAMLKRLFNFAQGGTYSDSATDSNIGSSLMGQVRF